MLPCRADDAPAANAPAAGQAAPPADATQPAAPPAPQPAPETPPRNIEPIDPSEATSILGKSVQGAAGENMGRVVDILVGADGTPRAAVIDFGGFLGVGSRKVAVAWSLLEFRPTDQKAPIHLGVTRNEVKAAPEYKPRAEPAQVVAPTPSPFPVQPPAAQPPAAPPAATTTPEPAPPAASQGQD